MSAQNTDVGPHTLSLWITPTIQINIFIYDSEQICFDFDTRAIDEDR
jgi:hypothetical protein